MDPPRRPGGAGHRGHRRLTGSTPTSSNQGWEIHRFGAGGSTVVHVPHAGLEIPDDVRDRIVLDDAALADELAAMTDWHTDRLALAAARACGVPSMVFCNRLSRLVIDPERLPDDQEPMTARGMGAVYRSTSRQHVLRPADPDDDLRLRRRYAIPYADALADLVDEVLVTAGRCVLVDLHSYPSRSLPYELAPGADRPAVCLGTDADHTPTWLSEVAAEVFGRGAGSIGENTPFAGTYVPLRHYRADLRVASIMIELRRDTYLDEPSGLDDARAADLTDRLAALLRLLDRAVPVA